MRHNIVLLTTQIKHWARTTQGDHALKLKVTFCVRGVISPVLANVYLHFVLDLWFEKKVRRWFRGEASLIRFADDFVASFQYKRDAESFDRYLRKQFARFNLELADDKTRLLLFGRFAAETKAAYSERPETFDFLGFTPVCGTDRRGTFAVVRLPSRKSCRKFLARTKEWLSTHRHWKRRDQQRQLTTMLRAEAWTSGDAISPCARALLSGSPAFYGIYAKPRRSTSE